LLTRINSSNDIYDGNKIMIYQSVSVCPKTSYTISARAKIVTKGSCSLYICENSGTSSVCSKEVAIKQGTQWTMVSKTFTTGRKQMTAEIDVFVDCGFVKEGRVNTVYLDSISIS
jgi:hypothetical protein